MRRSTRRSPAQGVNRSTVAAALTVVASLVATGCHIIPPPPQKGDPAPEFTAMALEDGSPVSLSDYLGETVLVNLWATWCHPCKEETPYLQSLHETYRDQGLRIVGVSVDVPADSGAVVEFVEEMGVEYDILRDPEWASQDAFRAIGLPTSMLIDKHGVVEFSWIGPIPEGDTVFLAGLEATLDR